MNNLILSLYSIFVQKGKELINDVSKVAKKCIISKLIV